MRRKYMGYNLGKTFNSVIKSHWQKYFYVLLEGQQRFVHPLCPAGNIFKILSPTWRDGIVYTLEIVIFYDWCFVNSFSKLQIRL